jgi:hypothetical protein
METNTLVKSWLSDYSGIIRINTAAFKLTIVMFGLLLSGCCINRDTYFLPDKVKEYVEFNTGSFWIYSDQNGRIDTFKVIDSQSGIGKAGNESCDETEVLSLEYFSSFTGNKSYSSGSGKILEINYCLGRTLPWISPSETNYTQEFLHDDTLVLNGVSFNDVYICEFPDPEYVSSYNLPFRYHLAKNVGIIKKEYADGSVFSIVEYHIEK